MSMQWSVITSPVGPLFLATDSGGLYEIRFDAHMQHEARSRATAPRSDTAEETAGQLTDYFRGALKQFNLPLRPRGTTFQNRVWAALREIPYGETASYGEIARRIGMPGAARAVGAANGRNPIPIVVPCHRVIGSQGRLTGYGGGLEIKRKLLELERSEALVAGT